ncbi:hypothetical protein AB0J80_17815 [Actinoplanes sp. NPDC049548]|uniref:hypothetical protein n=1 Tax=Actinoplanes sp. NPDC049548 TaxID=3155152 RepID=UPI0034283BF0
MTDDQADGRRLKPGHWLLIGIVVLLIAAAVTIIVRRGDADPTVAGPTPSAVSSASATPRPDCSPEITATWADAAKFKYGFVYRSRCDQVVRELRFRVAALDPSGQGVAGSEETATGGVLFPDSELAVAGALHLRRDQKVGSLKVQVISFGVYPPEDFSAWAHTEVVDPTRGEPDELGRYDVTGTVTAEPSSAQVCVAEFVLVMRDRTDKVIYADSDLIVGQTLLKPKFSVGPLPGLDFAKTKIYAPQTPRTVRPPSSGVSCNGS